MKTTNIEDLKTNNKIILLEPYIDAKTKILVRCLTCEHEWQAAVNRLTRTFKQRGATGCPVCSRTRASESRKATARSKENTEQMLLDNNNIQLLDPFTTAKAHHRMKCLTCEHEWSATPLSKKQTFKKHGVSGCPNCNDSNRDKVKAEQRANTVALIEARGVIILTEEWNGQLTNRDGSPVFVKVQYPECGHVHILSAKNLRTSISCAICGKGLRAAQLTQTSLDRSAEWLKTAPEWLAYRSSVDALTRVNYHIHKATINPNNYVRGLAGVEDAYQLDHIVPVRWCFDNNVPADVAAHHTNLQIIPWRENVSEGGTLKQHINIPHVLLAYVV